MNEFYNIVIIGASREGIDTAIKACKKAPNEKILLIANNLSKLDGKELPENLVVKEATVEFIQYKYRQYILFLNKDYTVVCLKMVLATGTKHIQFKCKGKVVPNTYYRFEDAPKPAPDSTAIVIGYDEKAIKLAIAASKKYRYVYLCNSLHSLSCDEKHKNKLASYPNIALMPACNIINFSTSKEGMLKDITLDTYSTIRCNAIFAALGREPDYTGLNTKFLKRNAANKIEVNSNYHVLDIPGIYAVGDLIADYKKSNLDNMISTLLAENIK